MATRDERIAVLATTLRSSGVAKSESQARMMAEEMIGVEDNVQKRFDEEHAKAQEYLKTAKNLGRPFVRPEAKKPEPPKQEAPKPQPDVLIQPLETKAEKVVKTVDEQLYDKKVELQPVHTDTNFGNKSLKDLMFNQIQEDKHEIKNIEELENSKTKPDVLLAGEPIDEMPKENVLPRSTEEPINVEDAKKDIGLDAVKLTSLMEEDGKLEEHTREIKEKPKVVKPKEEYEENNVDLSSMFNVNK